MNLNVTDSSTGAISFPVEQDVTNQNDSSRRRRKQRMSARKQRKILRDGQPAAVKPTATHNLGAIIPEKINVKPLLQALFSRRKLVRASGKEMKHRCRFDKHRSPAFAPG